jgi:hypothetical protein
MPLIIRPAGFTGTIQRLTVNNTISGVCNISAWGAGGGGGARTFVDYINNPNQPPPTIGGDGSGSNFAYASIAVDVGDVIDVIVGGEGGAGGASGAGGAGTPASQAGIPGTSGPGLFPDLLWSMKYAGNSSLGFRNTNRYRININYCEFLNNHGVWDNDVSQTNPNSFDARSWTVNFPTTGWYTFIMSADNTGTMRFDNNPLITATSGETVRFSQQFVTAGNHVVNVSASSTNTPQYPAPGLVAAAILIGQWFADGETFTFPGTSFAGGGGGRCGTASQSGGGGGGGGATVIKKNGTIVAVAGGGGGGGGGGALSAWVPGNFVPECNAPGELISITATQGGTPPVDPGAGGGGGGGGGGFSNISELNAGQYGLPRGVEQAGFGGSYGYSLGDDTEYISGNFRLPAQNPNANQYWNAARGRGGYGGGSFNATTAEWGTTGYAVLEFEQTGVSVQVDDVWQSVNTVWIKQNSQWREVQQVWVRQGGVWQRTLGTNNSAPVFENIYNNVGSIIGTNTYYAA